MKLTKPKGDSYSQLGFMPNYHGYNTTPGHYLAQYGASYFTADGKANLANDPAVTTFLKDQQHLVNVLGGYTKLEKYRSTFGDEYSTPERLRGQEGRHAARRRVALANLKQDKVAFPYAAAPMPVPTTVPTRTAPVMSRVRSRASVRPASTRPRPGSS